MMQNYYATATNGDQCQARTRCPSDPAIDWILQLLLFAGSGVHPPSNRSIHSQRPSQRNLSLLPQKTGVNFPTEPTIYGVDLKQLASRCSFIHIETLIPPTFPTAHAMPPALIPPGTVSGSIRYGHLRARSGSPLTRWIQGNSNERLPAVTPAV
ncbi:hypothetical protein AB1N83_013008 [Pleurotus pulmonarius]